MNTNTQDFASCPNSYMPACEYPQVELYWQVRIAYAVLNEAYGMAHQCMEIDDAEALVEKELASYAAKWGDQDFAKCRAVYHTIPCEDNPRVSRMITRCGIAPRIVTCNNCGCTVSGDVCPMGCPYADFAVH